MRAGTDRQELPPRMTAGPRIGARLCADRGAGSGCEARLLRTAHTFVVLHSTGILLLTLRWVALDAVQFPDWLGRNRDRMSRQEYEL